MNDKATDKGVDVALTAENEAARRMPPPFLKWAGGKRWLTYQVGSLAPESGTYFEPFLGSGAMFFHCRPKRAVLSDTNAALIGTYAALQENHDAVLKYLALHARRHSEKYYYALRAKHCRNKVTRAAQFIYLNRTCWNGLYRVNMDGIFNVPKGSKETVFLKDDDFETVSEMLAECEIVCSDFEKQIDRANDGDVVFADPPYTVRHKYNGFVKYNEVLFTWSDQIRLRDALLRAKQRGAKVFMTNADHESIRNLYSDGFLVSEVARYSAISGKALTRGKFSELLIT